MTNLQVSAGKLCGLLQQISDDGLTSTKRSMATSGYRLNFAAVIHKAFHKERRPNYFWTVSFARTIESMYNRTVYVSPTQPYRLC